MRLSCSTTLCLCKRVTKRIFITSFFNSKSLNSLNSIVLKRFDYTFALSFHIILLHMTRVIHLKYTVLFYRNSKHRRFKKIKWQYNIAIIYIRLRYKVLLRRYFLHISCLSRKRQIKMVCLYLTKKHFRENSTIHIIQDLIQDLTILLASLLFGKFKICKVINMLCINMHVPEYMCNAIH